MCCSASMSVLSTAVPSPQGFQGGAGEEERSPSNMKVRCLLNWALWLKTHSGHEKAVLFRSGQSPVQHLGCSVMHGEQPPCPESSLNISFPISIPKYTSALQGYASLRVQHGQSRKSKQTITAAATMEQTSSWSTLLELAATNFSVTLSTSKS